MEMLPENRFGYLVLTDRHAEDSVYIKANKIVAMQGLMDNGSVLFVELPDEESDKGFYVKEALHEIFAQLENIHPSML